MLISSLLFPVGIGLLLLSLALFALMLNERSFQEQRLLEEYQQERNLPSGELVYENVDGLGEQLISDQFPLVGKPAYVVRDPDGRLIPIEIKQTAINAMNPASHHTLQVVAYCLILEDYSDIPPTHGLLRYPDHEFTIEYTPSLRKKVIRTLTDMSQCSEQYPPSLQKQKAAKCKVCLFQPICPVGQAHSKK